jgi:hypothetical protein
MSERMSKGKGKGKQQTRAQERRRGRRSDERRQKTWEHEDWYSDEEKHDHDDDWYDEDHGYAGADDEGATYVGGRTCYEGAADLMDELRSARILERHRINKAMACGPMWRPPPGCIPVPVFPSGTKKSQDSSTGRTASLPRRIRIVTSWSYSEDAAVQTEGGEPRIQSMHSMSETSCQNSFIQCGWFNQRELEVHREHTVLDHPVLQSRLLFNGEIQISPQFNRMN